MGIVARCPDCGRLFKAKDKYAGLNVHCPDCAAVVTIRVPKPAAPRRSPSKPAPRKPARPKLPPRVDEILDEDDDVIEDWEEEEVPTTDDDLFEDEWEDTSEPEEEVEVLPRRKSAPAKSSSGRDEGRKTKSRRTSARGSLLAFLVILLLGISALLIAVTVVCHYSQYELLGRIHRQQPFQRHEAVVVERNLMFVGLSQIGTFLVTVPFFLIWVYLVHRNLRDMGAKRLEFTSGWAVGWFFVPFMNLVRPVQVMKEIWNASSPRYSDSDGAVTLWWTTYILSGLASRASQQWAKAVGGQAGELMKVTILEMVSDGLFFLAALFAIRLVWSIRAMQTQRFARGATSDDDGPQHSASW